MGREEGQSQRMASVPPDLKDATHLGEGAHHHINVFWVHPHLLAHAAAIVAQRAHAVRLIQVQVALQCQGRNECLC